MPHRKVHYWKTQMIMLLVTGSELLAFLCEQAVFALLGGIGKTFSSAEPKNRPSPRLSTPFLGAFLGALCDNLYSLLVFVSLAVADIHATQA